MFSPNLLPCLVKTEFLAEQMCFTAVSYQDKAILEEEEERKQPVKSEIEFICLHLPVLAHAST